MRLVHWRKRVAAAKRIGKFTQQDKDDAFHWNTCAIGEKNNFPKKEKWPKVGSIQSELGGCFVRMVRLNDPVGALGVIKQIEALP